MFLITLEFSSLSPPFPPSSSFQIHSLETFSWHTLSLVFLDYDYYIHINVCVRVCAQTYKYNLLHLFLLFCMYMDSGLTTLHWRANNGAFILKRLIALLPAVSSILKFFVQGLSSLKVSPLHSNISIDIFIFLTMRMHSFLGKTVSQQTF